EFIFSLFLYSICSSDLSSIFCPHSLLETLLPIEAASVINCLLYADDVVLIANCTCMLSLI
ncbi:hypothetical protein BD560DRAFT_477675, partial [Blakeslea trispora]